MSNLHLVLGTYNTNTVGCTHQELEKIYQYSYKPFLTLLYSFPKIYAAIHYSGFLLEWFDEKHPEILMLINEMLKRKQLELIGGGYYEPIFPLIPTKDRIGQIELLTTFIRKKFGKRPRGCWVPELVWEPSLSSSIKSSGLDYIFLDQQQFTTAGLAGRDLYSICLTEDQGKTLFVFPVSNINKKVFKKTPTEIFEVLRDGSLNTEKPILSMMLNGDNIGITEDSKNCCQEGGWLYEFFVLLSENRDRIVTKIPSNCLKNIKNAKRVYFPCTSYRDLLKWSLSDDMLSEMFDLSLDLQGNEPFQSFCGGYFRQFLTKYREGSLLYAKMLYVHLLINQVRRDKSRKKTAREESWEGQFHKPYWHGEYGGVYDIVLRKNAYSRLLQAEKTTREQGIFDTLLHITDFDFDGNSEYLFQSHTINAYIHQKGGVLFELDYLPTTNNYLATMMRYKEQYHHENDAVQGFDISPNYSFIDHFLAEHTSFDEIKKGRYNDLSDFHEAFYTTDTIDKEHWIIKMYCDGYINSNGKKLAVRVNKKYDFSEKKITVTYGVINNSNSNVNAIFTPEINLAFHSDDPKYLSIGSIEKDRKIDLSLTDIKKANNKAIQCDDKKNKTRIILAATKRFSLWGFPIYTYTRCGETREYLYQGNSFFMRWPLDLKKNDNWECAISLELSKSK